MGDVAASSSEETTNGAIYTAPYRASHYPTRQALSSPGDSPRAWPG